MHNVLKKVKSKKLRKERKRTEEKMNTELQGDKVIKILMLDIKTQSII